MDQEVEVVVQVKSAKVTMLEQPEDQVEVSSILQQIPLQFPDPMVFPPMVEQVVVELEEQVEVVVVELEELLN